MRSTVLLFVWFGSFCVEACQRDYLHKKSFDPTRLLAKRDVDLPALSEEETVLVNSFDNTSISDWSYYYTHGLHVAGTNRTMAQWTADRWTENGVPAFLVPYMVYLNYPVSHSLSLTLPNGTVWTASLVEEVLPEDEVTSYPNEPPTFHGYSASGEASAEYVYVGRGSAEDFERLVDLGVPLEGKIALAKYGVIFRGLKVVNSQRHGMIGCITFNDPGDDGEVTEAAGYSPYPDGPARNPTYVQRGSVMDISKYPGDPTTPGYPSKEGSPRADTSDVLPQIPSLPISWLDAIPLLSALDGSGISGEEVNQSGWVGALNVTYATGPTPGATISLTNYMEDVITPVWDVIGVINGTEQDEILIIGNHRDAWIVGGAADPNSGSSVLVELAKAFGKLQETGWKPKRTIVMGSWDAEEYGLLGSTEFVEEYIPWLTDTAFSYVNLDVAVSGPRVTLSAVPELHDIALEQMMKVIWPYQGRSDITMWDMWNETNEGEVGVLGSGSDYTAFLHRGISSLDVGSENGEEDPVYHYHSTYDSYHWMSTYGDPGYLYHKAMGQFVSLLIYHLTTDPVIPFNVLNIVPHLETYLEELRETISTADMAPAMDLSDLEAAIAVFNESALAVSSMKDQAMASGDEGAASLINAKFRDFARGFTSQGGLPDRDFYRHVLFAPGVETGYAAVTYPGVTEAVEAGNQSLAQEWVSKTSRGILAAAAILSP